MSTNHDERLVGLWTEIAGDGLTYDERSEKLFEANRRCMGMLGSAYSERTWKFKSDGTVFIKSHVDPVITASKYGAFDGKLIIIERNSCEGTLHDYFISVNGETLMVTFPGRRGYVLQRLSLEEGMKEEGEIEELIEELRKRNTQFDDDDGI